MIHSKAIDILKTFTKEELKQFSDFVRSPFHNKNKNLIKLFDVLEKYHPEYEVEVEYVYAKIYSGKSYSQNNIKKLMSDLLRLCERFLSFVNLEKEKFVFTRSLLKELYLRNLDDHYKIILKKTDSDFPEEYPEHYNNKSVFEGYKIEFNLTRNVKADYAKIHTDKFSNDSCYFLFQALIYVQCTTSIGNSNSKQEINQNLYNLLKSFDFDEFINKSVLSSEKDKLIYMIANMIKLTLDPGEEKYFLNAKAMFYEMFDLNKQEVRDDYTLYFLVLKSYCTRMVRMHKLKYCREQFELDNHRFCVMKNSKIQIAATHWIDIANTVNVAVYLNETDWAEDFLTGIKKFTYPKDFEYIYNYGKSFIEHRKGNPERSLEHSSKIFIRDHELKVSLAIINLICYYDLELYETAYSAIDSFSHQIYNSEKYNDRYKSLLKYFVEIYRRLLKMKENPEKISDWELMKIKESLNKKEFSLNDRWFFEKLKELNEIYLKYSGKRKLQLQKGKNKSA